MIAEAVLPSIVTILAAWTATSDKYIRTTVFLASVLLLVGISTHFRVPRVRHALVALGAVLLIISIVALTRLPAPP
jgi:hypothetical protein